MVGKTIGKYRVVERIGRGGMGTVYKAVDETLDRDVAIKVLNAEFGDAAVLKRFRAEAVTLARLSHPAIATIYELHHQDDELMMVMEFVRGETLHQLAERVGPLEPPQSAHLCMQVLDALGHAHRAGVIHRDLKPANLMVTDAGSVKVMDFGIARVLGTENYTLGGLTMGTPAYMAPEQVTGQSVDARSDLYSIGVVFYRLLSGRLPFLADTAIAMAQKQVSEQPTPLAEIRPDLPRWCTTVIDRALAKNPDERFQSAEEFRVTLAAAVIPQSISELPTLATRTLGTPLPTTATGSQPTGAMVNTPAGSAGGGPERTATTVVLGRNHLLALAALFVVLTAGIIVLAIAAFRSGTNAGTAATPAPPAAAGSGALPESPSSVPPPFVATPPAPQPSSPATTSTERAPGSVGRAGATKPSSPSSGATTPTATAKPQETVVAPPDPPAPSSAEPEPQPAVAFGGVRALVTDGDRLREREGVLRIADGNVVIAGSSDTKVLAPLTAITGLHFSRSRQPRWRDGSGKEVALRVDLGRFGFFRGDRNWLILTTATDPVILSLGDPQLNPVILAFETRTGYTVRRFQ